MFSKGFLLAHAVYLPDSAKNNALSILLTFKLTLKYFKAKLYISIILKYPNHARTLFRGHIDISDNNMAIKSCGRIDLNGSVDGDANLAVDGPSQ